MQKLKSIIKKVITSDPFDIINSQEPTRDQYSLAIHTFHSLSQPKR